MAGDDREPESWRIPPEVGALLVLAASAAAAFAIYGRPAPAIRLAGGVIAVVCLIVALTTERMLLRVDDEGATVRFIGRAVRLPWSDVARIETVTGVRGSATVRFVRHDGSAVDVPPSLLQPVKPMTRPRAMARLDEIARRLERRRTMR